jgi:hypothetical protein
MGRDHERSRRGYPCDSSNSGSCRSGWFSMYRVYNRNWTLVVQSDYSE